jgi:hypothetical protein
MPRINGTAVLDDVDAVDLFRYEGERVLLKEAREVCQLRVERDWLVPAERTAEIISKQYPNRRKIAREKRKFEERERESVCVCVCMYLRLRLKRSIAAETGSVGFTALRD